MADKVGTATQQIVRQVADVAKRTAVQQNPIVEVTVISRNPDGSLNVSDGRGGCLRMAPKANSRVGEKIRLGTEPAIGTQTSLQQVDLVVDPSTRPCPDDPRPDCEDLIGLPECVTVEVTAPFTSAASGNIAMIVAPLDGALNLWSDRNDPTKWGSPHGVANPALNCLGNSSVSALSPYHLFWQATRGYLQFDTGSLGIPADAKLANPILYLTLAGSPFLATQAVSADDKSVHICPSQSGDYPITSPTDWNLWTPTSLGSFRILDGAAFLGYPTLYEVVIPLSDDAIGLIVRDGITKFVLVSESDLNDVAPVAPIPTPPHGTLAVRLNQMLFKAAGAATKFTFDIIPAARD